MLARLAVLGLLAGCDRVFGVDFNRDGAAGEPIGGSIDAFADCPADYAPLAGTRSQYRIVSASYASFNTSNTRCISDREGATHLAVLDDVAEAEALRTELQKFPDDGTHDPEWWVGLSQRTMAGLGQDWFWITGEPLQTGMWAFEEPNDADMIENGSQQCGAMNPFDSTGYVQDRACGVSLRAVCECDGRALD